MNVVFAFSSRFYNAGCIAVFSVFDHNRGSEELNVSVIYEDFTPAQMDSLVGLAASFKRSLNLISLATIKAAMPKAGYQNWFGSIITYARLFLDIVLPDVNRILYIDSDTFDNKPLGPLWSFDLQGKTLAAAPQDGGVYPFNAGVLLIDLERWRSKGYRKIIDSLLLGEKTQFADNDILCKAFANDYRLFPLKSIAVPRWAESSYRSFSRSDLPETLTKKEFREWTHSAIIVHYNFIGKQTPYHHEDKMTNFTWSKTYKSLFKTKVVLPKKPSDFPERFAKGFRKIVPHHFYQKLSAWYHKKRR
jgi:Lipopolysaccharide biosynthesis proteins, LPS:glycosyltransferases